MLGGTAIAVASDLPMLPTCIALLSLLVLIVASRGRWTPTQGFGLANGVTTLRLFFTLALVIQPELRAGLFLALTALTILGLDLVDGWLARRSGGAGQFGARYDMEVDAVFVLSLSCALWARDVAGMWVLLAGLWRYLFVVIPLILPSRGGEAPRSILYRSAYAVMVTCFLLALVAPAALARPLAFLGTFVLSASFLRSFWYRYSPPSIP
jgi:phosphatidylglycerophosphate synthase